MQSKLATAAYAEYLLCAAVAFCTAVDTMHCTSSAYHANLQLSCAAVVAPDLHKRGHLVEGAPTRYIECCELQQQQRPPHRWLLLLCLTPHRTHFKWRHQRSQGDLPLPICKVLV
jgi:hypothetical protein